jgi:hypothetical protein
LLSFTLMPVPASVPKFLLPDALLSSPTSSLGDAVLCDLSVSSPVPANPLPSSTRSPDDAGENAEENVVDLGDDGCYFMCPNSGDRRGTRAQVDSAAPADSSSAPNSSSSGSGGNLHTPGAVGASSSAGANADAHASGSSTPAVELFPSATGPLVPQPDPSQGERSWSPDRLRLVLLMSPLLLLPPQQPVTRLRQGISKPKVYTDGTVRWCNHTTSSTGEPATLSKALGDKNWVSAMNSEHQALLETKRGIWYLVRKGKTLLVVNGSTRSRGRQMAPSTDTRLVW